MSLLAKLDRVVDWFIVGRIRPGTDEYRRARMFLISHLVGPLLGNPITVFLFLTDPDPWPQAFILGASITMFWALPFLLRRYPGRYRDIALLSVQNLIFCILWGSYNYGGASSPFLMWLLTVPLLAFFYLGSETKARAIVFAQIGLSLGSFYCVYLFNDGFPAHIPIENMVGVGIMSTMLGCVYVFVMGSYYARIVDSQSELLREVSRHESTLKKLMKAKDEADQANNAKSEFLAKMSHELRTPLNAVIGYSEILLEEAELDGRGEQISDLQKISTAGKHLLSMVNNVLDISKIEAGKTDLLLDQVDIERFLRDVENTSRPLVAQNTNMLTVDIGSEPLGMAYLDETKLRQAVLNLVGNAAKFTNDGQITIRARRETSDDGEWLKIAVIDNGLGISSDQQKALFSKFAQANAAISSKFGGTGLGLALSLSLCRLMGGDITLQSKLGQGSCFTIHLPAIAKPSAEIEDDKGPEKSNSSAASEVPKSSPPQVTNAARKRVIVVDDDPDFLDLAKRVLTKEGYSVLCTNAPQTTLQLARTSLPDVLLLDILMPDFDGWKVLAALKSDPVTKAIPVIVVSNTDEKRQALQAGAAAMMPKSVDKAELLDTIEQVCHPAVSAALENDKPAARRAVG